MIVPSTSRQVARLHSLCFSQCPSTVPYQGHPRHWAHYSEICYREQSKSWKSSSKLQVNFIKIMLQTLSTVISCWPFLVCVNDEQCVRIGIWCIGIKSCIDFLLGLQLVKVEHWRYDIKLLHFLSLSQFYFLFRCKRHYRTFGWK